MIDASPYATSFEAVPALPEAVRREMAALYLGMYDGSSAALFFQDLEKKDEVLLVRDGPTLVGFTTFRFFEHDWRGRRVGVSPGLSVITRDIAQPNSVPYARCESQKSSRSRFVNTDG